MRPPPTTTSGSEVNRRTLNLQVPFDYKVTRQETKKDFGRRSWKKSQKLLISNKAQGQKGQATVSSISEKLGLPLDTAGLSVGLPRCSFDTGGTLRDKPLAKKMPRRRGIVFEGRGTCRACVRIVASELEDEIQLETYSGPVSGAAAAITS